MILRRLYLIAIPFLFVACSGPQQLLVNPYPKADNHNVLEQYFKPKEPVIQPGDKITLSVWGHEELSIGSVNSSFSSNEATGRWVVVDNDGEVNLPQIGRVKLAGYDVKEVNYILEEKYRKLLKDPIINLKILNHYVTVLGEVNNPGRYELNNERMSLVEMIGEARGLSPYAKGHEIKVIRTVNQKPIELVVDMTDLVIFSEYNVVLQPDDVVYIGANKKKGADENLRRVTIVSSIITGAALVASVFLK